MKKLVILSAIISLIFTNCQQVVDADKLLDAEEKVSIISYISPSDTILRVDVSKALPSIGTPVRVNQESVLPVEFLITDAMVTISNENGDSVQLFYNSERNSYLTEATNLIIEPRKEYFLNVTVGEKKYNASCIIPRQIAEINETISFRDDGFGGEVADVNLSFKDFEGENNFYALGGFFEATVQFEDEEPFTTRGSLFFESDDFLTDNLTDGGILNGNGEVFIGRGENINDATITLQIANVEEVLFQNLRTADINEDAEGNPFVEYAIAPNNILDEGAVGVFAGYSLTEKVIEID